MLAKISAARSNLLRNFSTSKVRRLDLSCYLIAKSGSSTNKHTSPRPDTLDSSPYKSKELAMSFLSGFYSRVSAAFSQPNQGEDNDAPQSQQSSATENEASSRTLSPDDQGDVDTPERSAAPPLTRAPPTPYLAPPQTPFGGQPSPLLNQAAAEQLRREAETTAPASALGAPPTPFFGIFAPPQTPAARNLSPVRDAAAAQQLRREMLGDVPETPATTHANSRPTPMTQYKTPSMPESTPTEPLTGQSLAADAFQTPSVMPTKRQHQQHTPIQEESETLVESFDANIQPIPIAEAAEEEDESGASAASSPHEAVDMDVSSADENDTSTTSIESSDSEKRRAVAIINNKGRKSRRRPTQLATSKSYDDRRTRVQKSTRPGMSRSVSGREELLNRARKRFLDRKVDGERLF